MVRAASKTTRRRQWIVAALGSVLLLLIAGGSVTIVTTSHSLRHVASPAPTMTKWTAIQRWWAETSQDFKATRDASAEVRHAIDQQDATGLDSACQQVHDDAEIKLKAHLPSPQPDLTAEVSAAIEDYHSAAHMCLSVAEGSTNNYVGEFSSYLEEADLHMKAAQDIVDQVLIET